MDKILHYLDARNSKSMWLKLCFRAWLMVQDFFHSQYFGDPHEGYMVLSSSDLGVSLTLTCVMMHGHGCYLYLSDEGLSAGSNWQWECATRRTRGYCKLKFSKGLWGTCNISKVMRSLQKVFVRTRARNEPWPKESLVHCYSASILGLTHVEQIFL